MASAINAEIVETRGCELSGRRTVNDCVEAAKEATDDAYYGLLRNKTPSEKIIFCIDGHFSKRFHGNQSYVHLLHSAITTFIELKKQIAVESLEFGLLLMGAGNTSYVPVSTKKHINNALQALSKLELADNEPYDFSGMFSDLASLVQLPDPTVHNDNFPPLLVYHFILLFGRNLFVPKMDVPNAYFFLMDNPFVTLDILYIPDYKLQSQKKISKIAEALKCLMVRDQGYFLMSAECSVLQMVINKFLGHPSQRSPEFLSNIVDQNSTSI